MYEMFMGPLQVSKPWATTGISGVYRFLDRVWRLTEKPIGEVPATQELAKTLHKTIKKVTKDTRNLDFNTSISQMMILVNELYKTDELPREVWETLILLLTPYVPHLAEELWELSGHQASVTNMPWPSYREELTIDDTVEVVVQINGKLRAKLTVDKGTSKDTLSEMAWNIERIKELTAGKQVLKTIVVSDKLVNIVIKE
jgi:leucyl-tRNA synthetase